MSCELWTVLVFVFVKAQNLMEFVIRGLNNPRIHFSSAEFFNLIQKSFRPFETSFIFKIE